jgi:hypothetical protein
MAIFAPSPSRVALLGAIFAASVSCTEKNSSLDTSDTEDGTGPEVENGEPVWDNLSLESSVTLSGGFASGAGFYAIGEDGEVYVRSEGEWRQEGVNSDEPLNGIWGVRTDEINYAVAVGDGGTVSRLDETGWLTSQELNTANMEGIDSTSGTNMVAVGWGGAYRYADGAWEFQNMGGNPQFNDVWSDGSTTVAVGQDGVIAVSTGGDWTVENIPSRVALNSVSASSGSDIWIVGEDGIVLHNGSGEWVEVEVGTSATLWGVTVVGSNAYIVGNNGFALKIQGDDQTALPTGVDNNLYDITVSGGGVIWAVGNRGATLRLSGDL